MPLYNVGFGTYDTCRDTQFFFENILTKEELAGYVHRATIAALQYALEHRGEFLWGSLEDGIGFEELYDRVIEELKLLGFRQVEFQAEWSCQGSAPLCSDGRSQCDLPENKALREAIPDELKQKALKIAKQEG